MSVWFFEPLFPLFYEMLVVDPPWHTELYSEKGTAKSQLAHYETMTMQAILDLPIGQLASMDCMLALWSTSTHVPLAMAAIERWGFKYCSYLIWRKVTKNGVPIMGPGFRVRTDGEIVILATLGNPKQAWKPRTIFDGVRREHSRKPDEFYSICERMMPRARRADIFSRQTRDGWHTWGNERTKFDAENEAAYALANRGENSADAVKGQVHTCSRDKDQDLFSS